MKNIEYEYRNLPIPGGGYVISVPTLGDVTGFLMKTGIGIH